MSLAAVHERSVEQDVTCRALVDEPVVEPRQDGGPTGQRCEQRHAVYEEEQRYGAQRGAADATSAGPNDCRCQPGEQQPSHGQIGHKPEA